MGSSLGRLCHPRFRRLSGDYQVGYPIEGLEAAEGMEDVIIFHAGTTRRGGQILTDGGRVLGITALGERFSPRAKRAYAACDLVQFKNCHFRRDIGRREEESTARQRIESLS